MQINITINIMRQKHSNKKHRIVSIATQNIVKQNPDQIQLIPQQQYLKQNGLYGQQTLQAKSTELQFQKSDDMIKQNFQTITDNKNKFKQCKIRQLMGNRDYSPTRSDIDYIDSMEIYKKYLSRNKMTAKSQFKQNKSLQLLSNDKNRFKTMMKSQKLKSEQLVKDKIINKQKRQKQFEIIQEKISKVKTIARFENSQKNLKPIFDEIQKLRLAQKGINMSDNFCLLSVSEYMKLTHALQYAIGGNTKFVEFSKPICHKAVKRPLSHQARRWYSTVPMQIQKQVDPQSLIKNINFNKMCQNSNRNTQSDKKMNFDIALQDSQSNQITVFQSNNTNPHRQRLKSAPVRRSTQKCKTQLTINQTFYKNNVNKNLSRPKTQKSYYQIKDDRYKRQKIKKVKHMKKQKYDYAQFKKQFQTLKNQQNDNQQAKRSDKMFEYPWNWIRLQDTPKIHARQWKG